MKKYIFFLSLFLAGLVNTNLYGQGTNCLGATPICSGAPTTFPAVNGGTVPAGNNYGCLGAQPNPSWFTLTVGSSGAITINQTAIKILREMHIIYGSMIKIHYVIIKI